MCAVPPTVYNLKNVTQAEGHDVTLVCLSYGDPSPTMSFRKTNHSEPYQMGDNVSVCWTFLCLHKCIMCAVWSILKSKSWIFWKTVRNLNQYFDGFHFNLLWYLPLDSAYLYGQMCYCLFLRNLIGPVCTNSAYYSESCVLSEIYCWKFSKLGCLPWGNPRPPSCMIPDRLIGTCVTSPLNLHSVCGSTMFYLHC